jgi:hypothetical protein
VVRRQPLVTMTIADEGAGPECTARMFAVEGGGCDRRGESVVEGVRIDPHHTHLYTSVYMSH